MPGGYQALLERLLESSVVTAATAKRERLRCLLDLIEHLTAAQCLELVPIILPEVLLATKEVNEKTRVVAFELLLAMGRRMQQLGTKPSKRQQKGREGERARGREKGGEKGWVTAGAWADLSCALSREQPQGSRARRR